MTLSKYNEVMENLVITDEMRARILENVEKEVAADGIGNKGNDNNRPFIVIPKVVQPFENRTLLNQRNLGLCDFFAVIWHVGTILLHVATSFRRKIKSLRG